MHLIIRHKREAKQKQNDLPCVAAVWSVGAGLMTLNVENDHLFFRRHIVFGFHNTRYHIHTQMLEFLDADN